MAIGTSTLTKKSSNREGVERNRERNLEAMYVDIIKDREEGSNTNYNDFAVNDTLFNWETQNRVTPQSEAGKRYIADSQTMLLFVRQQNKFADDVSRTMGYIYLGEVELERWQGSRPMEILWRLRSAMPASMFKIARHRAIG